MNKKIPFFLIMLSCLVACSEHADPSYRPGPEEPEEPGKEISYLEQVNSGLPSERPDDAYSYSFYPYMDEWKNFDLAELQEKLDVKEEIISGLSTPALFYACWEYPLADSLLRKEAYQERFDLIFGDLAPYRLFSIREDAPSCLLSVYKGMDALYLPLVAKPFVFELLLSQPVFLDRYTSEERREIVARCLEIEQLRLVSSDYETFAFDEIHSLLMARILEKEAYPPFMQRIETDPALAEFIRTGAGFDRINHSGALYDNVIKALAVEYLN